LGADAIPFAASCRSAIASALLRRPTAHGAGPVTFFVLAKKKTKESRAHEAAAYGGSLCCSDGPSAIETRTISRLRREPRASDSRWPKAPARPALLGGFEGITSTASPRGRRDGVSPLEDAAAVRGSSGAVPGACLSDRRERVSRTARWCPAAQGKPQAGFARSPFFGDFLWRDKESHSPPGDSRLGRSSHNNARRAAARTNLTAHRSIAGSC
jgi:hypothetical protein